MNARDEKNRKEKKKNKLAGSVKIESGTSREEKKNETQKVGKEMDLKAARISVQVYEERREKEAIVSQLQG